MNTLDWEKEEITIENGNKTEKRTVYYYVVDGKRLEFKDLSLQPITCYEVLERTENIFNKESHSIIISTCSCGEWWCDSVLAAVEENERTTTWKLFSIHNEEVFAEYEFDGLNYYEVMKRIFQDAEEQIFDENFSRKKVPYVFYWENGETHPEIFNEKTYREEIMNYWKFQVEQKNNEPIYFEDARNNDYYRIKNGKWEDVPEMNWPPSP